MRISQKGRAAVAALLFLLALVCGITAAAVPRAFAEEAVTPYVVDFSADPQSSFIPYYISDSDNGVQEEFGGHWQYDPAQKTVQRINDVGQTDVTSQYAALYFKDLSVQYFEMEFTVKLGSEAGLAGIIFGSKNMSTRHLGSGNALYLLPDPKAEMAGSTFGSAKTSAVLQKPADGEYSVNLQLCADYAKVTVNGETVLNIQYPSELIGKGRVALFTANTGATFVDKVTVYALDESGERVPMEETVLVTGVELETETVDMMLGGEPVLLQARVLPENATEQTLYWVSEAPDIAVVDNDGYLHALKEGTSVIYAVSEDGNFRASCTVHVTDAEILVDGISLNLESYTGAVGERFYLIPTITPSDADDQSVSWRSSNTAVAMVNSGTVTLVGEGECVITVRDASGEFSAQCRVTVTSAESGGCSSAIGPAGLLSGGLLCAAVCAVAVAKRRKTECENRSEK